MGKDFEGHPQENMDFILKKRKEKKEKVQRGLQRCASVEKVFRKKGVLKVHHAYLKIHNSSHFFLPFLSL